MSLYRRPLPEDQIALSSPEGRRLFAEAMAAGGMDSFLPLIESFHTQSEPTYCGLGSLVMALNALHIDPQRTWKGQWRWFCEEMLDCCKPLELIRREGISLHELVCLARCNGAEAIGVYAAEIEGESGEGEPTGAGAARLQAEITRCVASGGEEILIAAYARSAVGQTGDGHYSPIGGLHPDGWALVLDVARFKYPPHWLRVERLFEAMLRPDPATGRSRGWATLRRIEPLPPPGRCMVWAGDGAGDGAVDSAG